MPIFYGVGQPGSVGAASGGKVWPINNLGAVGQQVVAANPARVSLTFHNPGATINLYIYPMFAGDGTPLAPSNSALGGTFLLFPGATIVLTGEIQTAWGAFAQAGSTNSLTVMDSNVG
jgi:hypothetical protein